MATKEKPQVSIGLMNPIADVHPSAFKTNPHITKDAMDESAHFSTRTCAVYVIDPETCEVTFRLDGQEMKRIKSRASTRNLADYFWEEILKRAINSHVY